MHYSLRKVFRYYMYVWSNSDIEYTFHNVPYQTAAISARNVSGD